MTRLRILLMLSPALLVIGGLFAGGLLLALVQSLGYFSPTGESTFTLAHYRALFLDREFLVSLRLTLILATITTAISAVAGLALAIALREMARHSRLLNLLLQVPLAIPHLVISITFIYIISPSGLIARSAFAAGLIRTPGDFPAFTNDGYGAGIILAYVLKDTPFIAVVALALLVR